ncbi:hypothetical protein KSS87_006671 [Heliosperma pusillum]|nr:hypothetical protein KSS87_006671 [Heliosperma pusillum]
MDVEEKKMGLKKRPKHGEMKLDSDDDEPIGSLLKLKRRSSKKVKLGVDGEKDKKVVVKDKKSEDFGGMEDTLASFKKKLKMKLVDDVDDEAADVRSDVKHSKKSEKKSDGKVKRSKSASPAKSQRDLVDDQEEGNEDLSNAVESLVDSLSSFLKKAQSGVQKKPRAVSGSKLKKDVRISENCPCPGSNDMLVDFQPASRKENTAFKKLQSESHTSEGPGNMPVGNPKSTNSMIIDASIRPNDNSSVNCFETVLDHSIPVSRTACSDKIPELNKSKIGGEDEMIEDKPLMESTVEMHDTCVSNSKDVNLPSVIKESLSSDARSSEIGIPCYTPTSELGEQLTKPVKREAVVKNNCIAQESNTARTGDQDLEDGVPLPSVAPKENGDSIENDNQCGERAARRVKKRKDGDMAYEGDIDWAVLMHDRRMPYSYLAVDRNLSGLSKDKVYSSEINPDFESGGAAAVSVGLKARSLSPVENIKFKEVLRRKGGLQQYLECRNKILSLWSKDVTRILPLVDCGITMTPSDKEPFRASLMRDIYSFLDQSGYINIGIAANKDMAEPSSRGSYKLLGEKKFEGSSGASIADSADGVSFILGQVKAPDIPPKAKDDVTSANENCFKEVIDTLPKAKDDITSANENHIKEATDTLLEAKDDVTSANENHFKEANENHFKEAADTLPKAEDDIASANENHFKEAADTRPKAEDDFASANENHFEKAADTLPKAKDDVTFANENRFKEAADTLPEATDAIVSADEKHFEEAADTLLKAKDDITSANENHFKEAADTLHKVTADIAPAVEIQFKEAAENVKEKVVHTSDDKQLDCQVIGEFGKELDKKLSEKVDRPNSPADLRGRRLEHGEGLSQSMMLGHLAANSSTKCDFKNQKRIIIVGAGPAGLTAARHLQRQGYLVTVLEARGRIGGRVHTDRSSLSVPVDLGASIITGVEADVASERRPDPSSLICAQLGLDLTILNSDCPLYDVVTGQKVPADVDESLEAEFNSLLDDMMLVVAQKGESATKMSLEDGLEFGLKIRRKVLYQNNVKSELLEPLDSSVAAAENGFKDGTLSHIERRVMDWHFAHLEYGCAALLKDVSLPNWNQDDVYGGFGGAHCMIKGGYSAVVESIAQGLPVYLNQVVSDISYGLTDLGSAENGSYKVKVSTFNGDEFFGDAVLITVPLGCLKADSIKFSPPLPQWKHSAIQRLGFGVLNKVVMEFPDIFWDDSVDYFGATAEHSDSRGRCFMFWNVKKTVGAPVLIALVVGKAAVDGQNASPSDHVNHALTVLRRLFGDNAVPDPVASVVTDWGRDPFSYGAYSYVAVGASGEDYDIIGRPVEKCLFFAGEATCKEHPDTVGGAMMSGLREAVRIIDILTTGNDYTAEAEAVDADRAQSTSQRNEAKDIARRLDSITDAGFTREGLLQDLFFSAKTSAGKLRLAKELLSLPLESLKAFAGSKEGLSILNSWILDSLGKDGTQLLRHCVRILVLVSTDLVAVRLSDIYTRAVESNFVRAVIYEMNYPFYMYGTKRKDTYFSIGKTVKEKVCVHTSRDIRSIASQLVTMWIEVFRKEKATNGGLKLLRHMTNADSLKAKAKDQGSRKPPKRAQHGAAGNNVNLGHKKLTGKQVKLETHSSVSHASKAGLDRKSEEPIDVPLSEEERAAIAAAEAAQAAALAAMKAYTSSEARSSMMQLPKIPSFQKFARREQYAQMDEEERKRWSGGVLGRQDCISEIDSRNCRVREWSLDFSATCANLENSRLSVDNLSQRSNSNDVPCQLNWREHSGESVGGDNTAFTKAWVESSGSDVLKDYHAIERWQCQAAEAEFEFQSSMHIQDEEDSSTLSRLVAKKHEGLPNESSVSQVTVNNELAVNQPKSTEHIKQGVVDYVASLLMPLYKARKIDKDGYKSIMKKSATKVMEQTTDAEKAMSVPEFLDYKRKNKVRLCFHVDDPCFCGQIDREAHVNEASSKALKAVSASISQQHTWHSVIGLSDCILRLYMRRQNDKTIPFEDDDRFRGHFILLHQSVLSKPAGRCMPEMPCKQKKDANREEGNGE